jgi:hypothetical protein
MPLSRERILNTSRMTGQESKGIWPKPIQGASNGTEVTSVRGQHEMKGREIAAGAREYLDSPNLRWGKHPIAFPRFPRLLYKLWEKEGSLRMETGRAATGCPIG